MMQACVGSSDLETGSNQGPASQQLFLSLPMSLIYIYSVCKAAVTAGLFQIAQY